MSKQVTTTMDYVPATRLELRWEKVDGAGWHCYYELIMPAPYDIRCDDGEGGKDGIVRIKMGGTDRSGGSGPMSSYDDRKMIDTPFRDGAHITWDMKSLNIRGFIRHGDTINEIVAAIHPNFEEEIERLRVKS